MRPFIAALCLACSPAFASVDEVKYCWNVGSLSSEAMRVQVIVAVEIDGKGLPVLGSIQMTGFQGGSEAGAKQAYEAARRAIIRCGATGFKDWRSTRVELRFSPEGIVAVLPPVTTEI